MISQCNVVHVQDNTEKCSKRDEEQYSSHSKNLYIPPTKITKQYEIKKEINFESIQ